MANNRYTLEFTSTSWHLINEGVENNRDPLDFTSTPWHLIKETIINK
jgi:hypothetical protein